jgi:hypothetical protein
VPGPSAQDRASCLIRGTRLLKGLAQGILDSGRQISARGGGSAAESRRRFPPGVKRVTGARPGSIAIAEEMAAFSSSALFEQDSG